MITTSGNDRSLDSYIILINPFTPKFSINTFSRLFKEICISEAGRIGSITIFHRSKLWKAKFSILCDVILVVGLQGNFNSDHSWE